MAAVAELERGLNSQRTKAALAHSTKRLGGYRGGPVVDYRKGVAARQDAADAFAARVLPMIQEQREAGASLQRIADRLTADGVKTARGGKWTPMAVLNAINRAAAQG